MKTYLLYSTENRAYICEADSKKQMKEKGMNMRLKWEEVKSYETAIIRMSCDGYELAKATRLSIL